MFTFTKIRKKKQLQFYVEYGFALACEQKQ
jgi:hypothetical protein